MIQVVSVEERTSQADAYVTLITENSDSSGKYEYIIDSESDSVTRTNSTGTKYWPRGMKSVKITYKAGYASTPRDLQLALFDLINYYIKDEHKERRSLGGAVQQNQGTAGIRNSTDFPDHIKRVLDLYKVVI